MEQYTKGPWTNKTYVDRFWSRIKVSGDDDCWEWTRGTTSDGYGIFHFGNSSIRTHRFSYQLKNGAIREHDCVCHSCDNPKCVNPSHLWIGTRAENNADKEAKGRGVHPDQKTGENNSNAILSISSVISIKVMAKNGLPQARIAKYFDVSNALVCMIINGERWNDITEQRISACVNACEGLSDNFLLAASARDATPIKSLLNGYADDLSKAKTERDELTGENAELTAFVNELRCTLGGLHLHGMADAVRNLSKGIK